MLLSFILRSKSTCVLCDTPSSLSLCRKHYVAWKDYMDEAWFKYLKNNVKTESRRAEVWNFNLISLDAVLSRNEDKDHYKGDPTINDRWRG